jgi:hypothetical protein
LTAALPIIFAFAAALFLCVGLVAIFQSLRAVLANTHSAGLEEDGSVKRSELLDRKRALLEGLRDLRQDHDTKKIDDDDFALLEASLREEIREVLAAIDARVETKREAIEALVRGDGR